MRRTSWLTGGLAVGAVAATGVATSLMQSADAHTVALATQTSSRHLGGQQGSNTAAAGARVSRASGSSSSGRVSDSEGGRYAHDRLCLKLDQGTLTAIANAESSGATSVPLRSVHVMLCRTGAPGSRPVPSGSTPAPRPTNPTPTPSATHTTPPPPPPRPPPDPEHGLLTSP